MGRARSWQRGPVTRIEIPAWAPAHARGTVGRAEGFGEDRPAAVLRLRDALLVLVHTTVEDYLRKMSFEDNFPQRDQLTGEYYVESEHDAPAIGRIDDPAAGGVVELEYRANFRVRCLQRPRPPHRPEAYDYLGLNIEIRCDAAGRRQYLYACDSSVI